MQIMFASSIYIVRLMWSLNTRKTEITFVCVYVCVCVCVCDLNEGLPCLE